MKKRMSLLLAFLMACTFAVSASSKSKSNADTQKGRYEIECAGTGTQGTYLVKVWSYSKKRATAENQSVKNAVHGVIFKGVPGKSRECATQKPLAPNPGVEHDFADFFEAFFADGGEFSKYGSAVGVAETVKVGKEYKVGMTVSVMKDQLRKDLEAAGVIKSLGSGF